ncbi:MAG: NAD(P)-binding domain-containing protein [Thermodesulfovibrio sp.]|nr:NAD(P)-binding domain-containing protein [Thermodesulfovibrio sp.]
MKFFATIVGAGPAGLAAAVEFKAREINDIVVFEKGKDICSTIRRLYPDGKRVDKVYKGLELKSEGLCNFETESKEAFLKRMRHYVKKYQIPVQFNTRVENIEKLNDLFVVKSENLIISESFIVIIATGVFERPNMPSYPIPETVKDKVFFRLPNELPKNEKILVVGGGNSAAEIACLLSGVCHVSLSYRREKLFRINEENLKELEKRKDKIRFLLGTDIERLEPYKDQIKVIFKDGSSENFSKIFYCLGGSTPKDFLKRIGVEFINNRPKIDEFGESNIERIFLIGDIAVQKGSIMYAFNSAHKAVTRIIEKYIKIFRR